MRVAHLGNTLQLFPGENFACWVVRRVYNQSASFRRDGCLELLQVQCPDAAVLLGRVQWDEDVFGALEDGRGVVLVKEGLHEDDLISWLEKGSARSVQTCILSNSQSRAKIDSPPLAPAVTQISSVLSSRPSSRKCWKVFE